MSIADQRANLFDSPPEQVISGDDGIRIEQVANRLNDLFNTRLWKVGIACKILLILPLKECDDEFAVLNVSNMNRIDPEVITTLR